MAREDWKERNKVLMMVSVIMTTVNFDDNGLCKDEGEHDRCDLAAIYFDLRADNGEGETLHDDEKLYNIFEPTNFEWAVLGVPLEEAGRGFYSTSTDNNGNVLGKVLYPDELEALRARCHSDNPDDEVGDPRDEDEQAQELNNRGYEELHHQDDGEIDF